MLYALALGLAALELVRCGHSWVALLSPLSLASLWRRRRQPLVGAVLAWRAGQWRVLGAGSPRLVALERWHLLPWVTFVAWREESGARARLWLFADSAAREQLRRLRVRLVLERGV